ncbi:hypothetical protein CASFOL_028027 [Castilleja foliolosa]|uniref:Uncharacterized protein n=1 Tax=Castilleja foliolosa TaxID=1961234 RepID=A0ABD3CI41_9LAMI
MKEILQNSEKRASNEVRILSERVHRMQASLDTIQSTDEVRELLRGENKKTISTNLRIGCGKKAASGSAEMLFGILPSSEKNNTQGITGRL